MIERHRVLHHKISGLSLVLSSCLVKPMFRRSTTSNAHEKKRPEFSVRTA